QVHGAGGVRIAPNIARRVLSRGGTQRRQGAVASLRILASDAAPHPGLPPHAGEGAGRPSRLHARAPLPRPRGRVGVGAKSDRCAAKPRGRHRPPPGPPPHAGDRAGLPSRPPARGPPPPGRGGGLGWGQSPTAAPQTLASDTAPIPAFPRMRVKEQGGPAASTPVPPLPRPRGRVGVGAKSDRCAANPRVRHRTTPAFP